MKDFFEMIQSLLQIETGQLQNPGSVDTMQAGLEPGKDRALQDFGNAADFKKTGQGRTYEFPGDCTYLIDYKEKRLLRKKGFEQLLGYKNAEVDFDLVLNGYHHDDIDMVHKLLKSLVSSMYDASTRDPEMQLNMTYRRRKKDGSYIHLLSQSIVHELDAQGNLLKSFTRLTDISYLELDTAIRWSVLSKNKKHQLLDNHAEEPLVNPFTNREMEVIKEIQKGGSNQDIADRLFVSHHTIATHRKNIFRKCNCHSVTTLLAFCKRLDIL